MSERGQRLKEIAEQPSFSTEVEDALLAIGHEYPRLAATVEDELQRLEARVAALTQALQEITDQRLDTTPGVSLEQALGRSRTAMREIAKAALASVSAATGEQG